MLIAKKNRLRILMKIANYDCLDFGLCFSQHGPTNAKQMSFNDLSFKQKFTVFSTVSCELLLDFAHIYLVN